MPDFGQDKSALRQLLEVSGEVVGTTDTQTLTNKKLTAPKLTSSDGFEITISPGSAQGANRSIDMTDMFFNDGLLYINHSQVTTNKQLQGIKYNQSTKTGDYSLIEADLRILADATSAAFTLTLPAAASNGNRRFSFKKIDTTGNIITIDANSTETIDGLLIWELRAINDEVAIISDGTNWRTEFYTEKQLLSANRTGTSAPNRYRIAGQINQTAFGTNTAVTANRLYAMPFNIDRVQTVDAVALNLVTQVSSSNARLGIYRNNNGVPGTLIADLGTVATSNPTGFKELSGLSQKLQPGIYWLTAVFSHGPTMTHLAQASIISMFGSDGSAVLQTGMYGSHTYGALPSNFPTIVMTTAAVSIAIFYHMSD